MDSQGWGCGCVFCHFKSELKKMYKRFYQQANLREKDYGIDHYTYRPIQFLKLLFPGCLLFSQHILFLAIYVVIYYTKLSLIPILAINI